MKIKTPADLVTEGIDAYAILGLNPSSGALLGRGIDQAYRKAINAAGDDRAKNNEINTALVILKDPALKKQHDEALGYGEKWQKTIDTSSSRAISDQEFAKAGVTSAQPAQGVDPKLIEEVKKEQEEAKRRIHEEMQKRGSKFVFQTKNTANQTLSNSQSPATVAAPPLAKNPFAQRSAQYNKRAQGRAPKSQGNQLNQRANLVNPGIESQGEQLRERADSDPTHLRGDELRKAILANRTTWQKLTASFRPDGKNTLTPNETAAHTQLENKKLAEGLDHKKTIASTLTNIRKSNKGRSNSR